MARTWVYLNGQEEKLFTAKAASLNLSESELTQKLIRLYLNVGINTFQPTACLNCKYYQMATSNVMKALENVNSFFSLIPPEWQRRKKEF